MSRKTAAPPRPRTGRAGARPAAAPTLAERAARSLDAMRRRELPFEHALLEDAVDLDATLRTVVGAFVPGFADWCLVDLADDDGALRRIQVAHAHPADAPAGEAYRGITLGPGWATPSAQAVRDRVPRLYAPLDETLMAWATWDAQHLAALRATGAHSLLAVPLVARGAALGALTLLRSRSSPAFTGDDLRRAVALAGPAALAIGIALRFRAMGGKRPRQARRK